MATGGADKKKQTWKINDKFRVTVVRDNPAFTNAKVEFQCFLTSHTDIEIKTDNGQRRTVYQLPILQTNDQLHTNKLKECFKKAVTKDKNSVMIPIDENIKSCSKIKFLIAILKEFIALAEEKKFEQNYSVKLEFCTMEDRNFGVAVKACEDATKEANSNPGGQMPRKSVGPTIQIVKASLENVKVGAIACTTSHDFNLSKGKVSAALLKKGGKDLQTELNKKSGRKHIGEVVAVNGYNLDCSVVMFGGMYLYNPSYATGYKNQEHYYRSSIHDFMQRCLNLAETRMLHSIAFPAIGAGTLKYPLDIVADQMFVTINDWRGTFVKEVKFVIYPKDIGVLKEFEWVEKKYGKTQTSEFFIENPDSLYTLRETFSLPEGYSQEFIEMYCSKTINRLRRSDCDVSFRKAAMVVKFSPEAFDILKNQVAGDLMDMKRDYPAKEYLDLTKSEFELSDVKKKVDDIERNTDVRCCFNKSETQVDFYGKMSKDVKDAKDKVVCLLLPARGPLEQSIQKDIKKSANSATTPKSARFDRQFSWSKRTKEVRIFEIKEKVTVKVYCSDILIVPVDCIVNAANTNLNHGGGIAKAIADAAGRDLTKEGRGYLKEHGKLRVGEACYTSAGKMNYKFVIHAVGPCWSDYKPYSSSDIERCETDLYNAVINSLSEAEKLKMETIAVSSISSGIYGCPLDLCSVQYAKAVLDYTELSKSPLKEIHFVDTNMEMVKNMHETFDSMISRGHIPRFYNKLKYVKGNASYDKSKDKTSSQRDHESRDFDPYKANNVKSGEVQYPYCHKDYPPGNSKKEFACCFGPGQNLYVYSADILSITDTDMIVCGNIPDGKTKGYLANAIKERGCEIYKAELKKAFSKKAKKGDVVICNGGKLKNFKLVAHAILNKTTEPYKIREVKIKKAKSLFTNIFDAMKSKRCKSIVLPLVGTGFGKADPVCSAQGFFAALDEFSSFNKQYLFKVNLVHKRSEETKNAISVFEDACKRTCRQPRKINRPKNKNNYSEKSIRVRPKSAVLTPTSIRGSNGSTSENHKQLMRHSVNMTQSENRNQPENMRMEEDNYCASTVKSYNGGKSLKSSTYDRRTQIQENDTYETQGDGYRNKEIDQMKEYSTSVKIKRTIGTDISPDRSEGSDNEESKSETKTTKGNICDRIFEATPQSKPEAGNQEKDEFSDDPDENDFDNVDDDADGDDDGEEEGYDIEPSEEQDDEPENDIEEEEVETCVICMDDISDPRTLSCGHVFCTECIEAQFTYKEVCPTCGNVCGVITGDQPYGKMDVVKNERASCAGFEGCGRIEIKYKFPDGTQGPSHPRPNTRYKGISRTAYLPNNKRGNEVCEMLKVAFERKLVFTIGNSRTTGAEGVITWNDIHHKTDQKPNTQFGYPDPSYLDRVTDELKIKGVTVDDIPTVSVPHRSRRR